jgi:glyoxylase-like metal-dependent hydrolase (beta-lactamase superfamily II)
MQIVFTDAAVIASEREAMRMRDENRLLPGESNARLCPDSRMPKTPFDRLVNNGDRLDSPQVIATPGHIAPLYTHDNTLIAGDTFGTQFKTAVAGKLVWRFPFSAMVT